MTGFRTRRRQSGRCRRYRRARCCPSKPSTSSRCSRTPAPRGPQRRRRAVNMVIKSGTNALHGSALYFNRNEALAALHAARRRPVPQDRRSATTSSASPSAAHHQEQDLLLPDRRSASSPSPTTPSAITTPSDAWVTQVKARLAKARHRSNPVSRTCSTSGPRDIRTARPP